MFTKDFLDKVTESISQIDVMDIELTVSLLLDIRGKGRLFIIGSGGGAGHASHAVCDFRKLCNFDALCFENLSELTARTNDEGWDTTTLKWLETSGINSKDGVLVISVGGGTETVSQNLVKALRFAKEKKAIVMGIVGKDGGVVKHEADVTIHIKTDNYITPITEGLQSVIWHLIVSHPKLQINKTIW
jgi:D-sedoheptulose 7-phosphate isomerase